MHTSAYRLQVTDNKESRKHFSDAKSKMSDNNLTAVFYKQGNVRMVSLVEK